MSSIDRRVAFSGSVGLPGDHAMEVELHFSVAHATNPFDQTGWLVLLLSLADDILEFRARGYTEGRLVDGLVTSIEFRDDEMASRPEREHSGRISVMVRA